MIDSLIIDLITIIVGFLTYIFLLWAFDLLDDAKEVFYDWRQDVAFRFTEWRSGLRKK